MLDYMTEHDIHAAALRGAQKHLAELKEMYPFNWRIIDLPPTVDKDAEIYFEAGLLGCLIRGNNAIGYEIMYSDYTVTNQKRYPLEVAIHLVKTVYGE